MANMHMDIAGAVVAVLMRGHNAGKTAEVFGRKLHAQLVGFHRQAMLSHVLGVEGDDPVMGFHLVFDTFLPYFRLMSLQS